MNKREREKPRARERANTIEHMRENKENNRKKTIERKQ